MANSPPEPDDFSLLLNQILQPVSVSSESVHHVLDPFANVSCSSVGTICTDGENEHDYKNEEGNFEALAEEAPAKAAPSRNPSKRSRAAEVHNLSEKRRRSRINEKMKALQNLIPNCNKTDKASMLDEAIEYLKQLQLQVQMLTMRNGLSLYPMSLPGVPHPSQLSLMSMGFPEENGPLNINLTGMPHVSQEMSTNAANKSTNPTCLLGTDLSSVIHSSGELGSPVQGLNRLTQPQMSSMVTDNFREDVLPHQQADADVCQTNLPRLEMIDKSSTMPISCAAQSSHREDNTFEANIVGSQRPDSELAKDLQAHTVYAPRFQI